MKSNSLHIYIYIEIMNYTKLLFLIFIYKNYYISEIFLYQFYNHHFIDYIDYRNGLIQQVNSNDFTYIQLSPYNILFRYEYERLLLINKYI
jgi:hypothetical protein